MSLDVFSLLIGFAGSILGSGLIQFLITRKDNKEDKDENDDSDGSDEPEDVTIDADFLEKLKKLKKFPLIFTK